MTNFVLGAAWIPLPIVDSLVISSIQMTMVISLYKYWGVAGVDAKTFAVVFLKSMAPVLVSFAIGYTAANIAKFFLVIGTIIGGVLDTVIASVGTIAIGVAVTVYLSQFVYHHHESISKQALEEDIKSFMKSDRFKNIMSDIKNLAKSPKQITSGSIANIIQKNE